MNIIPEFSALPVVLCIIWLVSIMTSRLYLGVHSPFDIVGGLLIGVGVASLLQTEQCLNYLSKSIFMI
jgi:membrane-associated phospholipid phosphatase